MWLALAPALLHQQNVTKTIQEQQLLITSPFCCTRGCTQTTHVIPQLPVILSSSLMPAKPSQVLLCNTQRCHLCDIIFVSTDLCSQDPSFRRRAAKMRVILMIKDIQLTRSVPDNTFYILRSDWNTRSSQNSECSKTNVQIHPRKLQTAVFYNQTRPW